MMVKVPKQVASGQKHERWRQEAGGLVYTVALGLSVLAKS